MQKLILALFLLIPFGLTEHAAHSQQNDSIPSIIDDTTITDLNFDENLDSLLNLYYVGQSIANDPEFWNYDSDSLVPNFSDSVYIERLKRIPTVVDLTYNSIVRRYIEVYTRQKEALSALCSDYPSIISRFLMSV